MLLDIISAISMVRQFQERIESQLERFCNPTMNRGVGHDNAALGHHRREISIVLFCR